VSGRRTAHVDASREEGELNRTQFVESPALVAAAGGDGFVPDRRDLFAERLREIDSKFLTSCLSLREGRQKKGRSPILARFDLTPPRPISSERKRNGQKAPTR
jgi:hypothetical protein